VTKMIGVAFAVSGGLVCGKVSGFRNFFIK
jgi:hypothetical protein